MTWLPTNFIASAGILIAGWGLLTLWFLLYEWSTDRGWFAPAETAENGDDSSGSSDG